MIKLIAVGRLPYLPFSIEHAILPLADIDDDTD